MIRGDVLITGGTGTLGRELVKQLLADHEPSRVIVYSRDELKQSEMAAEYTDERLRFFIGDVRDRRRLERAFNGVDYVIHCAAMKRVGACEFNPSEAVETNIGGTQNVIDVAINRRVKAVLGVSTDKATNPNNLYGATKLCAEHLMLSAKAYTGKQLTIFSVVRLGNVLGSRGSVVEIWRRQMASGVITVTDPAATRFVITPRGAVEYILAALEFAEPGRMFIRRLPSVSVDTVAAAVAPDAKREVVGLASGERLHETLVTADEAARWFAWWSSEYRSDQNDWLLDVDATREMLKEVYGEV